MQKVVDTIKIEKLEGGAFNVVQGDKYSDTLGYDEMLGLVSALTIAKEPICLCWMRTKEEHDQHLASIKNIPSEVEFEDILVPENIVIVSFPVKRDDYGDGLFIAFNNNKQLLGFCDTSYCVEPRHKCYLKPIQCKLIPCNRQDLNAGDTSVFIPKEIKDSFEKHLFDTTNYCKILDYQKYVYAIDDDGIETNFDNDAYSWYKVVPV